MTFVRHTALSCLLVWAGLGFATSCGEPAPQREWTPADHGQPDAPDPARDPAQAAAEAALAPEEAEARAASALWNASCASCHGRDGKGRGPSRPPGAEIADFTDPSWQASRKDAQLEQVIRDGRGMMPAFGTQLNEHGVRAMIAHIRRFGAGAAETAQGGAESGPSSPRTR